MPKGLTQVIQCRWDQVEVGDTVMDDRWAWQRWEKVTAIDVVGERVCASWSEPPLPPNKRYSAHANALVNVQVSRDFWR